MKFILLFLVILNIHACWVSWSPLVCNRQHVDKLTQVSCHILDLVIARDVNELISTTPTVGYHFYGHFTLICDLRNHPLLSRR